MDDIIDMLIVGSINLLGFAMMFVDFEKPPFNIGKKKRQLPANKKVNQ